MISKSNAEEVPGKAEERLQSSESLHKLLKMSDDLMVYRAVIRRELKKRGLKRIGDVDDNYILLEILKAAGPMPVLE